MGSREARVPLAAALIAFPASAALVATVIAVLAWPSLPADMPIHWGAGGVDGTMPRSWAVGLPLAMTLGASVVTLVRAAVVAADPRRLRDAAVVSGLVAWVGLGALAASVWPAELGFTFGLLAVSLILPFTLAVFVERYVSRRLPDQREKTSRPSRGS